MEDKNKFLIASMSVGLLGLVFASSTSALTYQEEIPVSFTFNRGLSLTVSASDLHIYNLVPGNSDESNIITVTTTSNNATGYVLTASVGNSTKNTTNLVNGSNNFASIATNASQASLTTDNTWGYSISTNNGSSWSNYSGLPIFSSTTWKEIASTNANGTTSILFKIGAKASSSQAAGDYTNVINFTAVTNYMPVDLETAFEDAGKTKYNGYYKMQDMTSSICSNVEAVESKLRVIDTRDDEVYLITKLNDGKCWMLDNLRLDPSDSATLANITDSTTNASATSINYFKNGGGTTSDKYPTAKINNVAWTSTSQEYYSIPMTINTYKDQTTTSYGAGSGKIGVYYNYCAASAGSYCYGNGTSEGTSSGNATEDLCPSGWRMPGGGSTINLTSNPPTGEFQNLYNYYNTTQTATDTNSLQYNLSTPLSGCFRGGRADYLGSDGYRWSSTRSSNDRMYYLYVSASRVSPTSTNDRSFGASLRCIAK